VTQLVLADFSDHLHQAFDLSSGGNRVAMTLIEVTALKGSATPARTVPFSLMFRGPARPQLSQGTYEFIHPRLGAIAIFIVPVGADENGVTYQAIFS